MKDLIEGLYELATTTDQLANLGCVDMNTLAENQSAIMRALAVVLRALTGSELTQGKEEGK